MKRICALMVAMTILFSLSIVSFATETGQTLDDLINGNKTEVVDTTPDYGNVPTEDNTTTSGNTNQSLKDSANATQDKTGGNSFMDGLQQAGDLTNPDTAEVSGITNAIRTVAAYIIKVLSYFIITFLAVRILLDLTFIALPFTRTFLANGYSGQAQSSGQGMMNPGMGGMGMNQMGGGMYGRSGYGMNRNMGMGGMGMNQMGGMGMQGQMAGQNAMMNRNSSMVGNIQFVSNAALNAVATESAIGPDGKTQSPFKIYFKDMAITLVVTPILIVLAITGVVSDFGFLLADFICQFIERAGTML